MSPTVTSYHNSLSETETSMKPAMWTDAFREFQPEEALERMSRLGWKYIELAEKHWRDIDEREDPEQGYVELKKLADRLGIDLVSMHGPMFNCCDESINVPRLMEDSKRAIRSAPLLGIKWLVFHPGSTPLIEDEEVLTVVKEKNLAVFRTFVEEAEKAGVGIAIENLCDHWLKPGRRRFGATVPELRWLLEELQSPNVGICWDTGHANIQRLDQYRAIKTLGNQLVTTHIADNDTTGDQHLLPFAGNVDWDAVTSALREISFTGLFALEVGGAVHGLPLPVREAKIRYARELTEALCTGGIC